MKKKILPPSVVIDKALEFFPEDVKPLQKYLELGKRKLTGKVAENALYEAGSHSFSSEYKSYEEIVLDVGKRLKADVSAKANVEENELAIIAKVFGDAYDKMSESERNALKNQIGDKHSKIPWASGGTVVVRALLMTGNQFFIYQTSVIVANFVARALLGHGLAFATNAALTRSIGVLLGPIGWIASGAWLIFDLAGPAYRITVPAIIHIGFLRQLLKNIVVIGVVGDGSVGKDSLMREVFNIHTGNIDTMSGSTSEIESYGVPGSMNTIVKNYPGFNDYRETVNQNVEDKIGEPDLFLFVVDANGGCSKTDIDIFEKLNQWGQDIIVCLNKADLISEGKEKVILEKFKNRLLDSVGEDRVKNIDFILTSFDPNPKITDEIIGVEEVRKSVTKAIPKTKRINWNLIDNEN